MSVKQKLIGELKEIALAFVYFAIYFLVLVLMKKLLLAEYEVSFYGLSTALVGALIVSKVVIVLQHMPLGGAVQRSPVAVDVILRTALYCFGVLVAVLLEHGFERRHEDGGFGNAIVAVIHGRNFYRVWATTIGVGGSILAFNCFSVLRLRFGSRALLRLFFKTPLKDLEKEEAGGHADAHHPGN